MGYFKTCPTQGPDQDIMKHIGPEVPDMGVIVYRRAAPVKTDLSRFEGFKGL
jgi:hypothetical protein